MVPRRLLRHVAVACDQQHDNLDYYLIGSQRANRRRLTARFTQRLPYPIGGCNDPRSDYELGAHEDERSRPADNPALGFYKLADLNGIYEMHVQLDGRLRMSLVGIPTGHSHRAVGKRHQHAALHDAAAVMVLRLRQERIEVAVAGRPSPERTD